MQVKSWMYKDKLINLPYVINVEEPKETWGIFGDSFAQLRENQINWLKKFRKFPYEHSWISFLANAFTVQCESYGVSNASVPDIMHTVLNCEKSYDRYIIFMTNPKRSSIFSSKKLNINLCKELKRFLKDKKVIICYWDKTHRVFNFGHQYIMCDKHITNRLENDSTYVANSNPLDHQFGYHHMSLRGNFLFFLDLYRLINSC